MWCVCFMNAFVCVMTKYLVLFIMVYDAQFTSISMHFVCLLNIHVVAPIRYTIGVNSVFVCLLNKSWLIAGLFCMLINFFVQCYSRSRTLTLIESGYICCLNCAIWPTSVSTHPIWPIHHPTTSHPVPLKLPADDDNRRTPDGFCSKCRNDDGPQQIMHENKQQQSSGTVAGAN